MLNVSKVFIGQSNCQSLQSSKMSEEPQTSPDIQVETDIAIHEKP